MRKFVCPPWNRHILEVCDTFAETNGKLYTSVFGG